MDVQMDGGIDGWMDGCSGPVIQSKSSNPLTVCRLTKTGTNVKVKVLLIVTFLKDAKFFFGLNPSAASSLGDLTPKSNP